ncbi:MAG: substrate-binding domain-containing protein [Sphingobium sp.]|nr:substrate-binding domain-containing protein [Sphingobium sp.]
MSFDRLLRLSMFVGCTLIPLHEVSAQTLIPFASGQSNPNTPPDAGNGTIPSSGANLDSLLGTGTTSIADVLRQQCQRIGDNNPAWFPGAGTPSPAPTDLQPWFSCTYEEEDSAFGRQQWRSATNQWTVTLLQNDRFSSSTDHVQYGFSDSSISNTDLSTFDVVLGGTAGAPVFFPLYVLPIAIAYSPVYGINSSGHDMSFHISTPITIGGAAVGGMRLSHLLYCGIFNGDIKNFNDPAFTMPNGGSTLQDTANDTSGRWAADGVPIRLVGRLDKAGETDIFTRALTAQCTGLVATNRYTQHAETLPYSSNSGVNFSAERSDTGLRPSGGIAAGTFNLVGREYFDVPTNSIRVSTNSASWAPSSYPAGSFGSGRYLVTLGSNGVLAAITFAPDYMLGNATLNGKIGYISSAYIANSPSGSPGLHAAALRTGATTGLFHMPLASSAVLAMGTITPPQSSSPLTGAYDVGDTRKNRNGMTVDRADPYSWYDVLYPTPTTGLAQPADGYPITGTTQFLGYRCYSQRNREHIVNLLGWETGAITHDWRNFDHTGEIQAIPGASNIGNLPAGWAHAITETFLTNSSETSGGTTLGSRNLWIQSTPLPGGGANATCTIGMGM